MKEELHKTFHKGRGHKRGVQVSEAALSPHQDKSIGGTSLEMRYPGESGQPTILCFRIFLKSWIFSSDSWVRLWS
jgi:hypothetical protein